MSAPYEVSEEFRDWWQGHLADKFHNGKWKVAPDNAGTGHALWLRVTTSLLGNKAKSIRGWPPVSACFSENRKETPSSQTEIIPDKELVWRNGIKADEEDVIEIPHDAKMVVSGGEDFHEYLLRALDYTSEPMFENAGVIPLGIQEAFVVLPKVRPRSLLSSQDATPRNGDDVVGRVLEIFLSRFSLPDVRIGAGSSRLLASLALSRSDTCPYVYIPPNDAARFTAPIMIRDVISYIPAAFLSVQKELRRELGDALGGLTCGDVVKLGSEGWQDRFRLLAGGLSASPVTTPKNRRASFGSSGLLADRFFRLANGIDDRPPPEILSIPEFVLPTQIESPQQTRRLSQGDIFTHASQHGFLSTPRIFTPIPIGNASQPQGSQRQATQEGRRLSYSQMPRLSVASQRSRRMSELVPIPEEPPSKRRRTVSPEREPSVQPARQKQIPTGPIAHSGVKWTFPISMFVTPSSQDSPPGILLPFDAIVNVTHDLLRVDPGYSIAGIRLKANDMYNEDRTLVGSKIISRRINTQEDLRHLLLKADADLRRSNNITDDYEPIDYSEVELLNIERSDLPSAFPLPPSQQASQIEEQLPQIPEEDEMEDVVQMFPPTIEEVVQPTVPDSVTQIDPTVPDGGGVTYQTTVPDEPVISQAVSIPSTLPQEASQNMFSPSLPREVSVPSSMHSPQFTPDDASGSFSRSASASSSSLVPKGGRRSSTRKGRRRRSSIGRGRRRSSLPPSLDVPLLDEAKKAVDTFRSQFDTYVVPYMQVAAMEEMFNVLMPGNPPQPQRLRSAIGDFLARGEYDFAVACLKSLRKRCVDAYGSHALPSQDLQPYFEQEFNHLVTETQSAALRLTGCRLPIPLLTREPP